MNIGHRASVVVSFTILPFATVVPLYVLGIVLADSADISTHGEIPVHQVLLVSLIHAPLLAAAAGVVARAFLSSRNYLFRYSPLGHFVVGAAILVITTYVMAVLLFGLMAGGHARFSVEMWSLSTAHLPRSLLLWSILGGIWGVGTAQILNRRSAN